MENTLVENMENVTVTVEQVLSSTVKSQAGGAVGNIHVLRTL